MSQEVPESKAHLVAALMAWEATFKGVVDSMTDTDKVELHIVIHPTGQEEVNLWKTYWPCGQSRREIDA